jgi:uncharacterized protein
VEVRAILGGALRFVGPERITGGTDAAGFGAQVAAAVIGLRDFQMPEELQERYGYPALSEEDRARIFGGNLAGLLGIETKRRVGASSASRPAESQAVRT